MRNLPFLSFAFVFYFGIIHTCTHDPRATSSSSSQKSRHSRGYYGFTVQYGTVDAPEAALDERRLSLAAAEAVADLAHDLVVEHILLALAQAHLQVLLAVPRLPRVRVGSGLAVRVTGYGSSYGQG